jgi:uncharacterized protein YodC (DUF2158 family)
MTNFSIIPWVTIKVIGPPDFSIIPWVTIKIIGPPMVTKGMVLISGGPITFMATQGMTLKSGGPIALMVTQGMLLDYQIKLLDHYILVLYLG